MKKTLIAAVVALAPLSLSGCTDAERANLFSYGDRADVKCYSGGQVVFEDESTGKIVSLDGDGFAYKSAKTGQMTRAFADCILTVK